MYCTGLWSSRSPLLHTFGLVSCTTQQSTFINQSNGSWDKGFSVPLCPGASGDTVHHGRGWLVLPSKTWWRGRLVFPPDAKHFGTQPRHRTTSLDQFVESWWIKKLKKFPTVKKNKVYDNTDLLCFFPNKKQPGSYSEFSPQALCNCSHAGNKNTPPWLLRGRDVSALWRVAVVSCSACHFVFCPCVSATVSEPSIQTGCVRNILLK